MDVLGSSTEQVPEGVGERSPAGVECRECRFATDADHDDDRTPAEVVVSHGRTSGHELSVTPLED